jgi:hypothetical protein
MARIGVFASRQWPALRDVLEDEDEIRKYKDELGLNLVVLGALPADDPKDPELRRARFIHSTEASSVRLPPPEVQAANPFPAGLRERIGPGVHFVKDDSRLRRAIELFKKHEVECWLVTPAWQGAGAPAAPELMARDLDGTRASELDASLGGEPVGSMFCPSNAAVNDWYAAYLPYLVGEYGVDGIFFTHTRYPVNAALLRACGCDACARAAAELGLGFDGTSMDEWLPMRAAVLGRQIERIAGAVKAVHPDTTFAIQSLFPSLALLLGQRPTEGFRGVDQVVFMMSYLREVALSMLGSLARMSEASALAGTIGEIGWTKYESHLPSTLSELEATLARGFAWEPWYEEFLSDEIAKAVAMTPSNGAMIGLRGNTWPRDVVDRLRADALSAGATGVVHQTYSLPWS